MTHFFFCPLISFFLSFSFGSPRWIKRAFILWYTFSVERWISHISWPVVILLCLTLGLAPFYPPHILEKLQMLMKGRLVRPIDWFDLLLHAAPWVLLVLKGIMSLKNR